jgi:hypothetical protein
MINTLVHCVQKMCSVNINLLGPTDYFMYQQVKTYSNSSFCTHSVCMCFAWMSEQTADTSVCIVNLLGFMTDRESVYCGVLAECLNTIQVNPRSWKG